jgi:hypothetical protein
MSKDAPAVILWLGHDPGTGAMQVHITRSDTAQDVPLRDGSFLLRLITNEKSSVQRCLIRHLASGREVYVQSGPKLRAFIKACLLISDAEGSETP